MSVIQETDSHKHLGVVLQKDCKWDKHIQTVIARCRVLISCLRSFKHRLSRKSLEIMYKSFIMPHFDFSDVVWDNCPCDLTEDLENLHLDALRTIVGAVRGTSHQKLYDESGFTSLKTRRLRHKLILFFKIVNGNVPNYLHQLLPPLVASTNPYHARNPLERRIPFCRTELYKNSFFPSTTKAWNDLSDSIKCSTSLSCFKRYLLQTDTVVPPYFYIGPRVAQIIHCRLRLGMSNLGEHLYQRHLSNNRSCSCGFQKEDTEHYLLKCPLYDQARASTILKISFDYTLSDLLSGKPSFSVAKNICLFEAVHSFILQSGRFGQ